MGECKDAVDALRRDIAQTYIGADALIDRWHMIHTGQTRAETLADMRRLAAAKPSLVGAALACAASSKGGKDER